MPFNFYETHTLLMAVQQLTPATTFLRDRYFPTNDASDVFATDDVLVEYRDGSKKLAPFVAPRKGGVTILRNGYHMERYTPPFVAPKRSLSADDLKKRGFGEALYTQLTPEQRQQTLILKDADELGEFITRREEAISTTEHSGNPSAKATSCPLLPRPPSAASRWATASAWPRTARSRLTSRQTTT